MEKIPEHLYSRLLGAVLSSEPDPRVDCQPSHLTEQIKRVFQYGTATHRDLMTKEEQYKPQYQINVKVVEAKNLPVGRINSHPYCLLTVTNRIDENPASPNRSPNLRKPSNALNFSPKINQSKEGESTEEDIGAIKFTKCVMTETENATWNEEFIFNLGSNKEKYLNIYLAGTETIENSPTLKETGKSRSKDQIKHSPSGILKKFVQQTFSPSGLAQRKEFEENIGSAFISIKDIPVGRWVERYAILTNKRKTTSAGKRRSSENSFPNLHIKMRLSIKTQSWYNELPEADSISIPEFIEVFHRLHFHSARKQAKKYQSSTYSGDLSERNDAIVEKFCAMNKVSYLSREILDLALLLQWNKLHPELTLNKDVVAHRLQEPFLKNPSYFCSINSDSFDYELNFLFEASKIFIEERLEEEKGKSSFFPPSSHLGLLHFNRRMEVVSNLCEHEIWKMSAQNPMVKATELLKRMIQEHALTWLRSHLDSCQLSSDGDALVQCDSVIVMMETVCDTFESFMPNYDKFFKKFLLDYAEIAFLHVDIMVVEHCRNAVLNLCQCLKSEVSDEEHLLHGNKVSVRMLVVLKRFSGLLNNYRNSQWGNKFLIDECESWFENFIGFWSQTWRQKSSQFTLSAIRKDRELEKAAEDVNFAESVVDILAIAKGVVDDFVQLGFTSIEIRFIASIKVTDIVCDNIIAYGMYLYKMLNKQSNPSKTLILRVANSIEYAGSYLVEQLPNFISLTCLLQDLKNSVSFDATKFVDTFQRLLKNAKKTTRLLATKVLQRFTHCVSEEIEKHVISITLNNEEWTQQLKSYMRHVFAHERGDSLLHFLEKVINCIEGSVIESLIPVALSELCKTVTLIIEANVHEKQQPDYYQQVLNHVKNVYRLFDIVNAKLPKNAQLENLLCKLHLNAQSTDDLILQYLASLADKREAEFTEDNTCSVFLKLGFVKLTNENVSILVKVINGINFPTLDTLTQSCDPYIRLELRPFMLFPPAHYEPQTTEVCQETLNPIFNEVFQFDLPLMALYTHGAVLSVMGIDQDRWSPNDIAGRVFIHLAQIPHLEWEENLENVINGARLLQCKLEILQEAETGPFKVLKDRQGWDVKAKEIVESELHIIHYRSLPRHFQDVNELDCTCGAGLFHQKLHRLVNKGKKCLKHSNSTPAYPITRRSSIAKKDLEINLV